MKRCWVIGPVAWDNVLHVETLPEGDTVAEATRGSERPGGSGFNVSCGLATVPLAVSLIGYCGDDEAGSKIVDVLRRWGVDLSFLQRLDFPTPQANVYVSAAGERSALVTSGDFIGRVPVPSAAAHDGDLVFFAAWDPAFEAAAEEYMRTHATVVVSTADLGRSLDAHYVVGNLDELPSEAATSPYSYLRTLFPSLRGAFLTAPGKAVAYTGTDVIDVPDHGLEVIDPIGAGDAFAAGVLVGIYENADPFSCLVYGQRWRMAASRTPSSMPPAWKTLERGTD